MGAVTAFIPSIDSRVHLVLALPELASLARAPGEAPSLARLLAAAPIPHVVDGGLEGALVEWYGGNAASPLPLAALELAARGEVPGGSVWLRATPLHLCASATDVRIVDRIRDLGCDATSALLAALNAHFAADALRFVAPSPDAWYLDAGPRTPPSTLPLALALDRPLRGLLPADRPGAAWRRWLQEAEMLLAGHEVNRQRERDGRTPVNGLWLSGGGRLRPMQTPAATATWGASDLAAGLAHAAGRPLEALPAKLDEAIARTRVPTSVVIAEAAAEWAEIEGRWMQPLAAALRSRRVAFATLLAERRDGTVLRWDLSPRARWARLQQALQRAPSLAATRALLEGT